MNPGVVVIFAGLLAFCGLAAATVAWTAPIIEQTLVSEATAALQERKLNFAVVEADGRDLIVKGEAPDVLRREEALRVVASTWGHRVVSDRMTVAPPTPAPAPAPAVDPSTSVETARRQCQAAVNALLSRSQIQFEVSSARVRANSAVLLDQLADALHRCPEARYAIEGHTDAQGSDDVNRRLSRNRARAVLRALAVRGVPERRMTATGFGSSHPIASNDDPYGRARNRRIELRVLRKD